jgi:hypothetical protein
LARILANENAETLGSDKVSEDIEFEEVKLFSEEIEVVSSIVICGSVISIISGISSLMISIFTVSKTIDLSVIE